MEALVVFLTSAFLKLIFQLHIRVYMIYLFIGSGLLLLTVGFVRNQSEIFVR